jgi:hypothetical protein
MKHVEKLAKFPIHPDLIVQAALYIKTGLDYLSFQMAISGRTCHRR